MAVDSLIHFTDRPDFVLDRTYTRTQPESAKPNGLWLSVGAEWRTWCVENMYAEDHVYHAYEVTLSPDANLLHLASVEEVRYFSQKYRCDRDARSGTWYMDWQTVARQFDGIIIAPYQWGCRLEVSTSWYYGWDVASGCIWNLDAIASVERVDVGAEVES